MLIKDIFYKQIGRDIDGVIKADDVKDVNKLNTEITEYVLTEQIQNGLQDFFDHYNLQGSVNGAWISGFFGSGKSHLLKMLKFLLDNYMLPDNQSVLDCFLTQCSDPMLQGAMRKACSTRSKNILFNIDQKSDMTSKKEANALLSVFLKVFDNECGYYGKLPYVAQFERDLDKEGKYEQFKEAFKQLSNKDWSVGRIHAILNEVNIAKAYSQVTGVPAHNDIIRQFRDDFKLSIEDFAQLVKEYIDKQEPGFRLNFMVDEVGQYIAGNSSLMINLQTIAESLQTACHGRSWIIVTSQEDLEHTVGDLSRQSQNDFSKIQARFKSRIKLTSQDVSEVIQRRLLKKKPGAVETALQTLYQQEQNNFQTLFHFENCYDYPKSYSDEQCFVNYYPFLPYQISMFSHTILALSERRAFEGQHSSVGERSMIGVFQTVGKELEENGSELGTLASFDMLFTGIYKTVKTIIQNPVLKAMRDWTNQDFAIRLLKVLFLVKYIDDKFKANVDNLTVLMRTSFSENQIELKQKIEKALGYLKSNSCIKQSDDCYVYLTDDERDVEEQIKSIDIAKTQCTKFLDGIIFGEILGGKTKIRYDKTKQDFEFAKRIDTELIGREKDLWIHVITPFEGEQCWSSWSAMGTPDNELTLILEENSTLIGDVQTYLKTKIYYDQNIARTQTESHKKVIEAKLADNRNLHASIIRQVKDCLADADIYINGDRQDNFSLGSEAKNRIESAFQILVQTVYPNLKMLEGKTWNETTLAEVLDRDENELITAPLNEEDTNVLNYIINQGNRNMNVSMKTLNENFSKKPYGWGLWTPIIIVAKLVKRNQVQIRLDGHVVENDKINETLRNTRITDNITLKALQAIDPQVMQKVKQFYHDLFRLSAPASEVNGLGNALKKELNNALLKIVGRLALQGTYPFLQDLEGPKALLEKWSNCFVRQYFDEMTDADRATLVDMFEKIVEPIKEFMESPRKDWYTKARQVLREVQENRDYLDSEQYTTLESILNAPHCYASTQFSNVSNLTTQVIQANSTLILTAKNEADTQIQQMRNDLCNNDDYKNLSFERQDYYSRKFDEGTIPLQSKKQVAAIKDFVTTFREHTFNHMLQCIYQESHPATPDRPQLTFVELKNIKPAFSKQHLETTQDVEQYLNALRVVLLEQIQSHRVIQR